MEFKNIVLLGAGAVGAYFIYGFTDLEGISFCIAAEGKRAEALKNEGVKINGRVYHPDVKTAEEATGADLLLVCTKYQSLHESLEMIEKITDPHTVVLSLLNGIDSEEIISERIGRSHLLYSVMRISSERRNGEIYFVPENTIGVTVGEKDPTASPERAEAFTALMKRAGLKARLVPNILLDQWTKYAMNIIYNLPQAILGVGFGAYFNSENVAAIRDRMFAEVRLVARAEGLPELEQGDWTKACLPSARFSTLQDLDAGRHTEIEMFAGTLIRLANKHNISVPFCEFAYYAIRALEEKGDGKFNF